MVEEAVRRQPGYKEGESSSRDVRHDGSSGPTTIVVTGLTEPFFEEPISTNLRSHFSSYGPTLRFVRSGRSSNRHGILIEYENQRDCRRAKLEMDRFEIEFDESCLVGPTTQEDIDLIRRLPEKTVFRVYYVPRTLTTVDFLEDRAGLVFENDPEGFEDEGFGRMGDGLLKPPMSNKNFLISPPGSPPVGWEQVVEDAPNQNTLAEDLSQRLRFLSIDQEEDQLQQSHEMVEEVIRDEIEILEGEPRRNIPGLKVQRVDSSDGGSKGMRIELVKATLESMLGNGGSSSNSSNRITPTARPDLKTSTIRS
ncbi:Calcipressin-domain-containing protein [Phakopsora pachyrhizi]|uniref:Calcipressin-domain-containing protein n=1 Tax=Phakopsora pachyrhizi TaxID=170000 RepID=A0AAV0B5A7_PHAPC|nr:Calcipressin-domain-containing protein [Phakopsora pachyrhizi]CAH7678478.1 Calcipressin-domain-containing protein [Phakopsora pachyrhizi]